MNEDAKMKVARFRFGVIHDLTGARTLSRGEKERIVQEKCSREWDIPFSGRSHISRSTMLNWVRMYEKSGKRLESLYPDTRQDKGTSRACDDETAMTLINLKKELKGVSLPIILRQARKRNVLPPNFKISDATIYRLFKRNGLMDDEKIYEDRRRFEAEFPQDIWQSDCMHGPKVNADGKTRKAYLFAFIDDASRLIPHAEFYLHERIDSYVHVFMTALKKRGVPRKLYVDNGPTFRSQHLE
jgi:transposase InsO family protein